MSSQQTFGCGWPLTVLMGKLKNEHLAFPSASKKLTVKFKNALERAKEAALASAEAQWFMDKFKLDSSLNT